MDPFAAAADALFDSSIAVDASYRAPGDPAPRAIRVIRSQPDRIADFGDSQIVQATELLSIRISEVAYPVAGAIVTIESEALELVGDPRLDTEGVSRTINAEPV